MWLPLIALITAGAPDAGTSSARPLLPPAQQPAFLAVPNALRRVDVPPGLKALGVPVQLSAVVSSLGVEELKAHFERTFIKAGLFVPTDAELDNPSPLEQVTGLDKKHDTSFSVLFQPNVDGTTTVIVGQAALHARLPQAPPFAPVFPGATGALVSESEAGRTLTYTAPAKADEVRAFYRDTFGKAGFASAVEGEYSDPRTGVSFQVHVTGRGSASGVVVTARTRGQQ